MPESLPSRCVLVASDLSEDSDRALEAGYAISAASGAALHIFHCVPQPVFPFWEGVVPEKTQEQWIRSARLDLEWQVRRVLDREDMGSSVETVIGDTTAQLNEHASAIGADLIVLGPHRSRGPFDDLLGTTADRVIRTSSVPCLLANRRLDIPVRQVLFPTDFSRNARHALETGIEWLCALLRETGQEGSCTAQLLYVSAFASPSTRPIAVEPRLAEETSFARERIPADVPLRLTPRIISAPMPDDGIRRVAENVSADLIVIGTHGYGMLGRALIGSVASTVIRTVPHSILLVPPPA
jgi:universal stress protein E